MNLTALKNAIAFLETLPDRVPMPDISTDAIDVSLNWQTPDKSVSVTIFSEPDGNSVTAAWLNRKTQVHGSCAFRLNSNDLSDRYAQVLISLRISAFFAPSLQICSAFEKASFGETCSPPPTKSGSIGEALTKVDEQLNALLGEDGYN